MALLSKRLNLFTESQTLKMAKLSRELKNKGVDIINLTLGEPDFTTPVHIKEAAKKAIDNKTNTKPNSIRYCFLVLSILSS